MYLICGEAEKNFDPSGNTISGSTLIIVPTENWKVSCIEAISSSGKIPYVLTFEELTEKVLFSSPISHEVTVVTLPIKAALIRELLTASPQDFDYLVGEKGAPYLTEGVLSRIVSALDQLMLREESDYSLLSPRTKQLLNLLSRFEKRLEEKGGHLQSSLEKNAWINFDQERWQILFPKIQTIVFHKFETTFDLLTEVLRKLQKLSSRVIFSLRYDPAEEDQSYAHMDGLYAQIYDRAEQVIFDPPELLRVFPEHTFQQIPPAGKISLFKAQSDKQEASAIATCIKSLIRDSGNESLSVLVVYPRGTDYEHLLLSAFENHNHHINITGNRPFKVSPLYKLLTTLSDFSRSYNFENLSRMIGVNGSQCLLSLPESVSKNGLLQELQYYSEMKALNFSDEEVGEDFFSHNQLPSTSPGWVQNLYNKITKNTESYKSLIDPSQIYALFQSSTELYDLLQGKHTLNVWSDILLDGILPKAANFFPVSEITLATRAVQSFRTNAHLFSERKSSFSYFFRLLKTGLSFENLQTAHSHSGVEFISIEDAVGRSCDYLFMAGLIDGTFPSLPSPKVDLTENVFSNTANIEISRQRSALQNLLDHAGHTIMIYPEFDGQIELTRSQFVDEIIDKHSLPFDEPENKENEKLQLQNHIDHFIGLIDPDESIRNEQKSFLESTSAHNLRLASYLQNPDVLNDKNFLPVTANICRNAEANTARKRLVPSKYDGIIQSPSLREWIYNFVTKTTFPVTQLDMLNQCQFKYFVNSVLRINLSGSSDEIYSSQDFGSILHLILAEILEHLKREKKTLNNTDQKNLFALAYEVADRCIMECDCSSFQQAVMRKLIFGELSKEEFLYNMPPEGKVPGYLLGWLTYELKRCEANSEENLQPAFFELNFGHTKSKLNPYLKIDPVYTIETDRGTIKIRGTIDRIDLGNTSFAIIDYKTGGIPSPAQVQEGLATQLPVYTDIARRILKENGIERLEGGALYYKMSVYNSDIKISYLKNYMKSALGAKYKSGLDDEKYEKAKETVYRRLGISFRNIRDGIFHPSLFEDLGVCDYCDLAKICKRDTERLVEIFGKDELWEESLVEEDCSE